MVPGTRFAARGRPPVVRRLMNDWLDNFCKRSFESKTARNAFFNVNSKFLMVSDKYFRAFSFFSCHTPQQYKFEACQV